MKAISFFIFSVLLVSCTDATDKPADVTGAQKKDSNDTQAKSLSNPYAATDVSPMDVIYFPTDYPVLKMSQQADGLPIVRVIYSRPHKQGRKIFGLLIQYNEPWRLGANEATEIEIFKPVSIQGKKVATGRYILYCVPQEKEWTIVFNTNIYSWGLKHDPAKDVYRFTVPVQKTQQSFEFFTMAFQKTTYGTDLHMSWENTTAHLPITTQ